jgi:restriction system protein
MAGKRQRYTVQVSHVGLNKHRVITDTDRYVVEQKAKMQAAAWDEMWSRKLEAEEKQLERQRAQEEKQAAIERKRLEKLQSEQEQQAKAALALLRTKEAQAKIADLEDILRHAVDVGHTIDWESSKDFSEFDKPKPQEMKIPNEPDPKSHRYRPMYSIVDQLFASRTQKKSAQARQQFEHDYNEWKEKRDEALRQHEEQLSQWEKERDEFFAKQKETNEQIDQRQQEYLSRVPRAVVDYCNMVLSNAKYPDSFSVISDLDYVAETRTLVVDYQLPSIEALPKVKEVKYIMTRDEFKEIPLSEPELNKLYDEVLYQTVLRSVHELFETDKADALDAVVFNGWVCSIDKATGQEKNACILSLHTTRKEFTAINLTRVDPKLCFRNLKGVGSPKLHTLTPIAPIMQIDRNDERFIRSYDVMYKVDESSNIAAMDWEDFEHLIRELFEKEFTQAGGEVRITQASRDRGVDAVAFDPDPIRGGKIVIQAKRYTNTVDVSAVRDLYGTVLNEGATKGILVTTSDYGPDAHEFAKGKPLTLLSGSNLLHLLAKHGYKARIDLQEARITLASEKR